MPVGGILYLVESMTLYLVSDLQRALSLKAQLNCPHIHFVIEPHCCAFTSSLVWMEVLSRAANICQRESVCIVSYEDKGKENDSLSSEDIEFFKKLHLNLEEKMIGIEVVKK